MREVLYLYKSGTDAGLSGEGGGGEVNIYNALKVAGISLVCWFVIFPFLPKTGWVIVIVSLVLGIAVGIVTSKLFPI